MSVGGGIPNIYHVWVSNGWEMPVITEKFEPERVTLTLSMKEREAAPSAIKIGDNGEEGGESAINVGDNETEGERSAIEAQIVEFLTDHATARTAQIAAYIGRKPSRTRDYLKKLVTEDIVEAEGENRNRIYRLKR